jgi:hypothetical protein
MRRLGFWKNSDSQQIKAINEAADELGTLSGGVGMLNDVIRKQHNEIVQLKAALQAVCDLLVDLDLIEEQAFAYRVEAALADVQEKTPPHQPDKPIVPATTACGRCKRSVPSSHISFTDRGQICDACVGALAAESID